MADKGKRMIFEDEYQYLKDIKSNHPDPSAEWGGGGGDADIAKKVQDTAAGQIGVVEVVDEEDYATLFLGIKGENDALYKNYIDVSSDGTVALKANESFEFGVQGNKGSFFAAKEEDIEITPDTGYDVNIKVGNGGNLCVTQTGQGTLVKKPVALEEDIPSNVSDLNNDAGYITSSDISNMVTTDTNQYISGEKTFTSEIKVTDLQGSQTELHKDKLIFHGSGTTNVLPNVNAISYGSDVDVTLPATPGTLALTSDIITSYNDLTDKPTIPDAVSGTNDGTNWTTLTIGNDTYGIPQGGSSGGSFDEKDFSLGKVIGSCLWTNIPTKNSEPLYLGKLPFGVAKTALADFINLSSTNTNDSHLDFGYVNSAGYTETCTLPDNTQVTAYGYITNLYSNLRIYVYTDVSDTYNNEFWDTGNTYFWIQYWGTSQLTFNGEVAVRLTSLKAYKSIYGIPSRVYHHVVKFTAVDSNSNNITGNIHLDTTRNVNLTVESVLKTELCNYLPNNSNIIVQGYLDNGQPILLASTVSAAYTPYGITISYYDSTTSAVVTGLISSFSNLTDTVV